MRGLKDFLSGKKNIAFSFKLDCTICGFFSFYLKLKRDFLDIQTCSAAFSYLAFSVKSLIGSFLELTIG